MAFCGRDVTLRGWCDKYSQVKEPNHCQDRQTENFYYEAMYTALLDATITDTTLVTLKKMKAKIARLHHEP